jgi:hypothetical protein
MRHPLKIRQKTEMERTWVLEKPWGEEMLAKMVSLGEKELKYFT